MVESCIVDGCGRKKLCRVSAGFAMRRNVPTEYIGKALCHRHYHAFNQGYSLYGHRTAIKRTCVACGVSRQWQPYLGQHPLDVCRSCHEQHERESVRVRRGARGYMYALQCGWCDRRFDGWRSTQEACSVSCANALRDYRAGVLIKPVPWFACVQCGEQYIRHSARKTCDRPLCKAELHRIGQMRGRTMRRLRHINAYIEDVDPLAVYIRDRWICQLCNEPVLRIPRYVRDPQMASLDHVIPIAQGGEHSYANVQCAHLQCNLRKGRGKRSLHVAPHRT